MNQLTLPIGGKRVRFDILAARILLAVSKMVDDERAQLTSIEIIQAFVSLTCISVALLAVAMSAKQWSAHNTIESSYNDVVALHDDPWLGISREAHPLVVSFAIVFFVPVVLLAALRRTAFHYVACATSGLALIAAGIAWFLVARI